MRMQPEGSDSTDCMASELARLRQEVAEQDRLLTGYQVSNHSFRKLILQITLHMPRQRNSFFGCCATSAALS